MLNQLMARLMMTSSLATLLTAAHTAQKALMLTAQVPPQPRTRSHAGAHYPRHRTNSQDHFPFKSGMGPRECARRRGDLKWLNG